GKRFLNPLLGRWVSADPLAIHSPGEADLNLYAYVHGTVLKSVDPLGLAEGDGDDGVGAEGGDSDVGDDDFVSPYEPQTPNPEEAWSEVPGENTTDGAPEVRVLSG